MAKLPHGLFGNISGKIGNYVLVNRDGELYVRSAPSIRQPNSPAQEKQCSTLGLVSSFLAKVSPLVKKGFRGVSKHPRDSAKSYNMKVAVDKSTEVPVLDYRWVLVTRGDLIKPEGAQVSAGSAGLRVNWTDNSGFGSARSTDRGLIAVYSPELHEAICITEKGPRRNEEHYEVTLPDAFAGKSLHVYFSFVSEDGNEISNSVYLGEVLWDQ